MNDQRPPTLDELLTRLPRQLTPERDLWPRVAADVNGRTLTRHGWAMAACLALVCVAGALSWAILHGAAMTAATVASSARKVSFDEPGDPAYIAARAQLERSFHERLALLDPATRAKIESSLDDIRRAHEQIRQDLAAQPESPVLEGLLESIWHDEFDLYDSVVQGTEPAMLRS